LEILQQEISDEAMFWFGASWDSKKEEYISDKGNSVIILREIPTPICLGVQSTVHNQKNQTISHYNKMVPF